MVTKFLVRFVWNQQQDESDNGEIRECVEAIQANVDELDPVRSPDPIALICVLDYVLWGLVPKNIVDEYHDEPVQILHKHLIHQVHKISWCIG